MPVSRGMWTCCYLKIQYWVRSGHDAQNSDEIFGRSCMILRPSIVMTMLHLEYERPSRWQWLFWEGLWGGSTPGKGRVIFWRDPLGRCSCVGEDRARSAAGSVGAVETVWAPPGFCGCAVPAAFKNVLLQRLHFLSWFATCSGNVHSLNSQIHIIRNFRQKKTSPFCIQLPFL